VPSLAAEISARVSHTKRAAAGRMTQILAGFSQTSKLMRALASGLPEGPSVVIAMSPAICALPVLIGLTYSLLTHALRSQHFQGLRRAQHKAETSANGSSLDSPRKADPTMNPITRRPGPGRGRPRKQPPAPVAGTDQASPSGTGPGVLSAISASHSHDDPADSLPVDMSMSVTGHEADDVSLVHDEALDEQPAKRQRMDDNEAPSNDDEAVLALAADGLPGPDDHYDSQCVFCECFLRCRGSILIGHRYYGEA
jgi:hypothetical protein